MDFDVLSKYYGLWWSVMHMYFRLVLEVLVQEAVKTGNIYKETNMFVGYPVYIVVIFIGFIDHNQGVCLVYCE